MKSFLQYIQEKSVLGLIEFFDIDGVGKTPAKLDSGNGAYNVIHGFQSVIDRATYIKYLSVKILLRISLMR